MTLEFFPFAFGEFPNDPRLAPLPGADAEVDAVADLFAEFGAHLVPWDTPMEARHSTSVDTRRAAWASSTANHSILYWVGHGWADATSAWLAHANSTQSGDIGTQPNTLARAIRARADANPEGHWTIVIIDACRSAQFIQRLSAEIDIRGGPRSVLLVGTSGAGSTNLGRFTRALHDLVRRDHATDPEIDLWHLASGLRTQLPDAEIVLKVAPGHTLRRDGATPPPGIPLDISDEIRAALATLTPDERYHYLVKAQGAEIGEMSWYYQGRHSEAEHVVTWLREHTRGLLVVTGDAGAGKSAFLGHLVLQTRPGLRRVLAEHALLAEAEPHHRAPDDIFDTVVHLAGMSTTDLINHLAAHLELGTPPLTGLTERLTWLTDALRRRTTTTPCTILADALDEGVDPLTTAQAVLRSMAALPGVRLVVGTRRSTLEGPDHPNPADTNLLTALGAHPSQTLTLNRDPQALYDYITASLNAAVNQGALHVDPTTIAACATAVSAQDKHFLFARLLIHEIRATGAIPAGNALRDLLTTTHRGLFSRAVDRLANAHPVNRHILAALAYARGRGIPLLDNICATIATAVATTDPADPTIITPHHVHNLINTATPYILHDREHGHSVYRLAHRTFAEHFTSETTPSPADRDTHHRIATALINHSDPDPKSELNPYTTHHLTGHCVTAGQPSWESLATHTTVLDRLNPQTTTNDAMQHAFGHFPLPPAVAGIIGASHLLPTAPANTRRALRQIATRRHGHSLTPEPPPPVGDWDLNWLNTPPQPVHKIINGHTGGVVAAVAVPMPDGRTLIATGSIDGTVRLWDPVTGTQVGDPLTGHDDGVVAAVPMSDGRTLIATGSIDGTVRLWDPVTGTQVGNPLTGHRGGVRAVAAVPMPDGRTLIATGGDDGRVRLWDPATGTQVGDALTGHDGWVWAVAAVAMPDGRTLIATGSRDGTVRLWDPATGTQVGNPLTGHDGGVRAVAAVAVPMPDGRTLIATGGDDGRVRLWDPATGTQVGNPLTGHDGGVVAVAAVPMPDGRTLLATGGADGTVRLWDLTTGIQIGDPLTGHTRGVWAVAAVPLPDGRILLATGGDDATVRLWDLTTGIQIGDPLTGHTRGVWAVAAVPLPDGRTLLATGGDDATVRLWDPATGIQIGNPLTGHDGGVWAVAAVPLPDGRILLATGGDDATVRLWDPATGTQVGNPLTGHDGWVWAVAAVPMPDGRTLLATSSIDRTVRLWDPATGTQIGNPLTGHDGGVVAAVAVPMPDGRTLLATGGDDATVRLWDPATGTQIGNPLTGHHDGVVAAVAVPMPDRRTLIATGSRDGSVRLWDPTTGHPSNQITFDLPISSLYSFDLCSMIISSSQSLMNIALH
ncbi:WD40 repeat domain-containing protein [Actinokineospora bangkokensis]|uniref:Nephrocystin 3-like N-terminal domain-containing protein n=1 Tax=Actinokineospora bangkokensis TaxID=1193682 RepID=A0A1Q9LSP3_9PSEU|nr:WD40 repeat domain-containing protein [Actinokineospora bangkokensis]OLR95077.1 hypothetical protein BJP25_09035 [Actinokineospora bangkokensis]